MMDHREPLSTTRSTRRAVIGRASGALLTTTFALALQPGQGQAHGSTPAASPMADMELSAPAIDAFFAQAASTMGVFGVPGAAVAIVRGNDIIASTGFGQRDLGASTPVTTSTRFRIGSNTKSMTTMMLASMIDEGLFGWDTPVLDLWPDFLAPSPALTADLRVRDLLGMGSGIAESPTIEFFMSDGTTSAIDLLQSTAWLPVIGEPGTTFYYNNTLICVGAFTPLLAAGVPAEDLGAAYAAEIQARVFDPIGMTGAALVADPRLLPGEHAVGYTTDLDGTHYPVPFISINGAAPAGQGLASVEDMARYIITQKNGGRSPAGEQVVSTVNLDATHQPGIEIPTGFPVPPEFAPDTTASHYGLGWFIDTYTDGSTLVSHAGGIDGFSTWMGFWPDADLGLVVLSNLEPGQGGGLFTYAVRDHFTSQFLGLNVDGGSQLEALTGQLAAIVTPIRDMVQPLDADALAPYLGYYSDGFTLRLLAPDDLRLEHDIRSLPVAALSDGTYVVTRGPGIVAQQPFTLGYSADGTPIINLSGFTPIIWQTGIDDGNA
jgi:CubicO group peptidase (beta-lactamase class C family)